MNVTTNLAALNRQPPQEHHMNRHVTFHPETGEEATRNSKNRTYSHAIWVQIPWEWRVRSLENEAEGFEREAARCARTVVEMREGLPISDEGHLRSIERWNRSEDDFKGYVESSATRAALARAEADRIRQSQEDEPWGVIGWAGRPDLAEKRAASEASNGWRTLITEAVIL